jgi:probable F420-dependent oxidoreductase
VQIGLLVNVNNFTVDPATLARDAEELGFESLWVGDHPVIPVETTTPMPGTEEDIPEAYAHVSDPFVALAMMAPVTTRLKLGLGVCVMPNRNPILTALQAATLDFFSGGRLLFGVGAGWLKEQIEVMGGDYPHRLAQTREYVEAMRALWRDPEASFSGTWVNFPPLKLNPRPAQLNGPPVLLGTWGPKAVLRVAEWADGWLPMMLPPDELAVEIRRLREECERIGRDPSALSVTVFEYEAGVDRAQSQEIVARFEQAGVDRLVLIQGLGDHTGSHEWALWSPDEYRGRLEQSAERYL